MILIYFLQWIHLKLTQIVNSKSRQVFKCLLRIKKRKMRDRTARKMREERLLIDLQPRMTEGLLSHDVLARISSVCAFRGQYCTHFAFGYCRYCIYAAYCQNCL